MPLISLDRFISPMETEQESDERQGNLEMEPLNRQRFQEHMAKRSNPAQTPEQMAEEGLDGAEAVVEMPHEAQAMVERWDEEQILAEMTGNLLQKCFYNFSVLDKRTGKRRQIVGLSYAGVKQIAHRQGGIKILGDPRVEETEGEIRVWVKFRNDNNGQEMPGVGVQSRIQSWNGLPDPFALQKALSKACRNAMRAVVPESIIITMLEKYVKTGRKS